MLMCKFYLILFGKGPNVDDETALGPFSFYFPFDAHRIALYPLSEFGTSRRQQTQIYACKARVVQYPGNLGTGCLNKRQYQQRSSSSALIHFSPAR